MCLFAKAAAAPIMQRRKRWGQIHAAAAKPRARAFVPGGGGPQPLRYTAQFRYYVGGKSEFRYIPVQMQLCFGSRCWSRNGNKPRRTRTQDVLGAVTLPVPRLQLQRMYTAQKRFKKKFAV
jgi:hypothetical protein